MDILEREQVLLASGRAAEVAELIGEKMIALQNFEALLRTGGWSRTVALQRRGAASSGSFRRRRKMRRIWTPCAMAFASAQSRWRGSTRGAQVGILRTRWRSDSPFRTQLVVFQQKSLIQINQRFSLTYYSGILKPRLVPGNFPTVRMTHTEQTRPRRSAGETVKGINVCPVS